MINMINLQLNNKNNCLNLSILLKIFLKLHGKKLKKGIRDQK